MWIFNLSVFKKLWIALGLFLSSLVIGTVMFMLLEGFKVSDALYMSVITFSTVGFQEVHPLSEQGRLFTAIYIIGNLGIFAYVISVFTTYLFEGELRKALKNFMIGREVRKMKDHIIICGFGRNGIKAAEVLHSEKKKFVILEREMEVINSVPGSNKYQFVQGDATQDEILLDAGIMKARTLITTLPRDSDNVFIVLTARQLNPAIRIIARASESESELKLYRAGANNVVMPDSLGGAHMAQLITKPYVIEFLEILNGASDKTMALEEVSYQDLKEEFRDISIRQLDVRNQTGASIISFKRGHRNFMFNPSSEERVSEGDVIILLGLPENIEAFRDNYCS